ncbi:MAG: DUF1361 domain-containing protein [Microthrixaceae bacterium]|nr:DUF1361 domain-containing protein [Microthrixaceae bacterium]MCO5317922.1 DUF1361 domain-containing protein [Microthrixaceae bacterium]
MPDPQRPSHRLSRGELRSRAVLLGALLATGVFPVAMLVARTAVARQISYRFLLWNLFLAGLPVLFALGVDAASRRGRTVGAMVLGLGWLLVFPNAPYLLTDLVHLREVPPSPLWFDALILGSAAIAGLLAGFVSLHFVQEVVSARLGQARGWVMSLGVLGLTGFGVYIGRFARFNSWDVFTRPRTLLYDVGSTVALEDTPRALVVTALVASFLMVTYVTIEMLTRVGRELPRP